MKIRNIKWDIDIDDVLETIDEMTVEEATEVLGFVCLTNVVKK